ncbi:MAG: type I glutamate--ammonia ligase [Candidatus Brocadiaceae bacterium]|jgi:glutamine synthetase
MGVEDVLKVIEQRDIRVVDLRFMDFPGQWQHFSIPAHKLTEESFDEGFGIDASSVRGWRAIEESDMLVRPDPEHPVVDPFSETPTLILNCTVADPITKQNYDRDPRYTAIKAENYLRTSGIGDVAYFGPEAEFFIFDEARFDTTTNAGYYYIDSVEGSWNTGREENPNLAHKIRTKGGYFPVPPVDSMHELRNRMMLTMEECGMEVECHHHEVATGGQAEIDLKYDRLLRSADNLLLYKYVVKNVARRYQKTATFMPKPLFGDNGNGMHIHFSIWKDEEPLFAGDGYAGLSDEAIHAIGGVIRHARALVAITSPTTNSYRRLVPGYEAPVNLAYSCRNRSVAVRIPMLSPARAAKRIEFRCPDPSCNPYFAFSAILMAALDGIKSKTDPGKPLDKNIYELPPRELAQIPRTPGSLAEALDELEADHEFLLHGDVFTQDVIRTWIDWKRTNEVEPVELRPHPHEFELYFDV